MYKAEVTLINEVGLHARPASIFVSAAKKYDSEIVLIRNEEEFDAKSILSILTMGAAKGESFVISATGADEKEAVNHLKNLVESNFELQEGLS